MYNFENDLMKDEKIIYQGRPVPGKGAKNIGGLLFVFLFCLGLQILMIWSLVAKVGDGTVGINFSFIVIFFSLIGIESFSIYGIIYNCFIKKRKVKDHYYCLTTERVLKYDKNKDRLVYGYLYNYDDIHYNNTQEGYGDVYFSTNIKKSGDSKQDLISLKNAITNPDFTNMTYIAFESISTPKKISVLAKKAQDEAKSKYNKEIIK